VESSTCFIEFFVILKLEFTLLRAVRTFGGFTLSSVFKFSDSSGLYDSPIVMVVAVTSGKGDVLYS
jgi:hypothetical protein